VLKCLSGVLLPFLIAWLLAYLIYPIVTFVQYRLKFRFRIVSIVAVLLFIIAIATGFIMLALPSLTTEIIQFKDVAIGL
jgi:predicted PurR-regulated permease PerM